MIDDDPQILYVLMRTDVPDFMMGRAAAQANHAGTLFMRDAQRNDDEAFTAEFTEWVTAADGFGICIVLGVKAFEMRVALSLAKLARVPSNVVHDPDYFIRDGDTAHHVPVDTCAYLFGPKSRLEPIVGRYRLLGTDS